MASSAAEFLRENERWVVEQMDFVKRSAGSRLMRPPMTFSVLGEDRHVCVIEESTTRKFGIIVESLDALTVRVPKEAGSVGARALERWLRRKARRAFAAALERRTRDMGLSHGRVYIMGQRTRWGSCSSRRNLSFNWRLVMAPPAVLDYLVVHELAHLAEASHSTRFWLIVRSHCPDFQQHRNWLRDNADRLRHPLEAREEI